MSGSYLYSHVRLLFLVVGIILVAGVSSYTTLPRMEDPILTQRIGIVRTVFPGADAERVESQITRVLEEDIRKVNGIKTVKSESMAGMSHLGIELKEAITDVETVWSQVRDEISETEKRLPEGALRPDFRLPEMRSYASILALRWDGEAEPNFAILDRLADDLKTEIRTISGTETVRIFGEPEEEIVVEVPREVLHRMGLTVGDLSRQIEESETKGSAGLYRGEGAELVIELDGDLETLDRLGATPIRYGQEGRLANLSDIASIRKTTEEPSIHRAIVDGKAAVVIATIIRKDAQIDRWTKLLGEEIEAFEANLPAGVSLQTLFSQNVYVHDRLIQLGQNLLVGTLAVVVVVFFLMGWRSMIVVGLALPLSAGMVLWGMRLLEIPVHQMSVTGLIIALGLLIDNAIVMVDEVGQGLREGRKPTDAIRHTIKHLGLPLFGSTLTTTLAFTPIALLPGASGEFVGSIATSVILAINSSFLLAMTVVPALTALVYPAPGKGNLRKESFWSRGIGNERLGGLYRGALTGLFRVPVLGVVAGVCLPLLGFYLSERLPEQFFPPADRDQVQIELELSAAAPQSRTREVALAVRDDLLGLDGVDRVHWFLGESSPSFFYNLMPRRKNAAFYAQAFVELKPEVESGPMIRRIQRVLDERYPEARILVRQLEQGPPFDAPVEVNISGPDVAVLQELGEEVRLLLSRTRNVVHTQSDLSETVPKLALHVDEFAAKLAGLTHQEIEQQLYSSLEGLESGSLVESTEEIPIRVRVAEDVRGRSDRLSSFELRPLTPMGRSQLGIPLSAIGSLDLAAEVSSIPRVDGKRVNEIKAYITAGVLPHLVLVEFQENLEESGFVLPPGYEMDFGGESAERDQAVRGLMADIPLLVVLMIAILVTSFGSFRAAFVITVVGGLSIGLGLGSLWLFDYPFGFMGVVGTMGLVGVAVNDAIVVMAGIQDDPKARIGDPAALADIVIRRTRHIIATSLTTMAGFTPLVLGGGAFWPPVAITIAGGVLGATILALVFVPSIYLFFVGRGTPVESGAIPAVAGRDRRVDFLALAGPKPASPLSGRPIRRKSRMGTRLETETKTTASPKKRSRNSKSTKDK